jgi:hypothetical protein
MSTTVLLEGLAITEAVEVPIYSTVFIAILGTSRSGAVLASLTVNLLSYPVFLYLLVPTAERFLAPAPAVWAAEVAVWGIETGLLRAWLRRDLGPLATVALLANASSFLIGLIIL